MSHVYVAQDLLEMERFVKVLFLFIYMYIYFFHAFIDELKPIFMAYKNQPNNLHCKSNDCCFTKFDTWLKRLKNVKHIKYCSEENYIIYANRFLIIKEMFLKWKLKFTLPLSIHSNHGTKGSNRFCQKYPSPGVIEKMILFEVLH